jgi:hypothetical protein
MNWPKIPIPKKVWQSVALANIAPEFLSYAIFKDIGQALLYVGVCAVVVVAANIYEEVVLPRLKKKKK